jgi:hypothetical protein
MLDPRKPLTPFGCEATHPRTFKLLADEPKRIRRFVGKGRNLARLNAQARANSKARVFTTIDADVVGAGASARIVWRDGDLILTHL